jgi:hypothetical protein
MKFIMIYNLLEIFRHIKPLIKEASSGLLPNEVDLNKRSISFFEPISLSHNSSYYLIIIPWSNEELSSYLLKRLKYFEIIRFFVFK